jgi:hypothetical protein
MLLSDGNVVTSLLRYTRFAAIEFEIQVEVEVGC